MLVNCTTKRIPMNFCKTILSYLFALTAFVNCTCAAERPNILFFFADDWVGMQVFMLMLTKISLHLTM